ncbi:MAG: DUF971 domain-containing protein [Bryobacterales bacterium]|nr:DUF971 domain-containing protein [Bryobacteraceae bacterium]MDW8353275.1 DUF971 domain-containing protein [Bryobacterales bacterium]
MPAASEPERISVSRATGIQIVWKDGHTSQYELQYLRDRCPCATCRGAHETGPTPPAPNPLALFKPKLRILDVEPVGAYALRIRWNDGHSSGIYSYAYLRQICSCAECTR